MLSASCKAMSERQIRRSSPVQLESTNAAVCDRDDFLELNNFKTGRSPPRRDNSFLEGVDGEKELGKIGLVVCGNVTVYGDEGGFNSVIAFVFIFLFFLTVVIDLVEDDGKEGGGTACFSLCFFDGFLLFGTALRFVAGFIAAQVLLL